MRRHGRRARLRRRRRGPVRSPRGRGRCFQRHLPVARLDQHVGEDRDGVAPFDDAVDVAERLEQERTRSMVTFIAISQSPCPHDAAMRSLSVRARALCRFERASATLQGAGPRARAAASNRGYSRSTSIRCRQAFTRPLNPPALASPAVGRSELLGGVLDGIAHVRTEAANEPATADRAALRRCATGRPGDLRADPDDRPPSRRKAAKPQRGRKSRRQAALAARPARLLDASCSASGASSRPAASSPITPANCRRSTSSRCRSGRPTSPSSADDGSLIANRGDTGGAAVRLSDLPPYLPKAFVAIEDRRFYSHFGVDPIGIFARAWSATSPAAGR